MIYMNYSLRNAFLTLALAFWEGFEEDFSFIHFFPAFIYPYPLTQNPNEEGQFKCSEH